MKIKIIPETEAEKQRFQTVEHKRVINYFICGNKKTGNDLEDFHDWTGSYRYLEGSLYYFLNTISEERKDKRSRSIKNAEIDLEPPKMIKRGTTEGEVKVINTNEAIEEPKGQILQFPTQEIPVDQIQENNENNENNANNVEDSKGAED